MCMCQSHVKILIVNTVNNYLMKQLSLTEINEVKTSPSCCRWSFTLGNLPLFVHNEPFICPLKPVELLGFANASVVFRFRTSGRGEPRIPEAAQRRAQEFIDRSGPGGPTGSQGLWMQTRSCRGPSFIQTHCSPLQRCRGAPEESYIFISFAKPRSLTRVRLRSSRQRQEMAELWCTTAINVSREGKTCEVGREKKRLLEMPFGNKTFASPITSWFCAIHQLPPRINTV